MNSKTQKLTLINQKNQFVLSSIIIKKKSFFIYLLYKWYLIVYIFLLKIHTFKIFWQRVFWKHKQYCQKYIRTSTWSSLKKFIKIFLQRKLSLFVLLYYLIFLIYDLTLWSIYLHILCWYFSCYFLSIVYLFIIRIFCISYNFVIPFPF